MKEWTGVEVLEERNRLERDAATLLGLMLFEHSRLDMDLGLLLAWVGEGRSLDQQTEKVVPLSFSKRLDLLTEHVSATFRESPDTLRAYAKWIDDANVIRKLRNDLVHGRWGVQAIQQRVLNIVGLPTSPDQKTTPYSIEELRAVLNSMRELRERLQKLRSIS